MCFVRTGLDCLLDPGVVPEPTALLRIAAPTALLVAPGAALAAAARLAPLPRPSKRPELVFLGDSLVMGHAQ